MAFAERRAEVVWQGNLFQGNGKIAGVGSKALAELPITWVARIERADGKTSPEELLAAAHAACYAMSLSNTLAQSGKTAEMLEVDAICSLERTHETLRVARMELNVRGRVPGLDEEAFEQATQKADQGCLISNALRNNVDIRVIARLEKSPEEATQKPR